MRGKNVIVRRKGWSLSKLSSTVNVVVVVVISVAAAAISNRGSGFILFISLTSFVKGSTCINFAHAAYSSLSTDQGRWRPDAIEGFSLGAIQTHHHVERAIRRGQPVRFQVLAR